MKNDKTKIITPVLLAGGSGARLWPISRKSYPKQFLNLYGSDEKSLLQQTQIRINDCKNIQAPILICNEDNRFLVAEQMRSIGVKPKAIILEPHRRNTCAAITLGALKALELGEDSILLVLSADHKIKDKNEYKRVIEEGYKQAEKGNLVTFGVIPTYPETGYGYIESINKLDKKNIEGSDIKNFIEKPNKNLAAELIKNNKFTWNSGIFMFSTNIYLRELKKYAPEIFKFSNRTRCRRRTSSSRGRRCRRNSECSCRGRTRRK